MDPNLFRYGVVAFFALAAALGHSSARDLRPSDHGLAYQEDSFPPAQNGEMRSFFGAAASVQLPEAKNISEPWVSAHAEGRSRDVGKDHVRLGLLVASAVCGLTGIVLLAISGIVFIHRLQRQRIPATSASTSVPQNHATHKN